MRLSDWSENRQRELLKGPGLFLHTGPFISHIRTAIPAVAEGIALLYADNPAAEHEPFADFHLSLERPRILRRWYRPQVLFNFDGLLPFKPLPISQALPFLEWGLNWSVASHANNYLVIHAAAIERNGLAAILPGPPGSGKSTLTAFLVHRGWRLLSDELALISLRDGSVTALARPVSLKNESIDIIGQVIDGATLSKRCEDTSKGTVALLKAPVDSVERVAETARPAWVIFPKYETGAEAGLTACSKADTLIDLGDNAFNYSIHGKLGFEGLARMIDNCGCYNLRYSDLFEAERIFDALEAEGTLPRGALA